MNVKALRVALLSLSLVLQELTMVLLKVVLSCCVIPLGSAKALPQQTNLGRGRVM